jgi:hypothetical protein
VYNFNQSFHFLASIIIVLGLALSSITYWSMDTNSNSNSNSNNNSISFIPSSYLVTAQTDTDNFSNFNKLLNHNSSSSTQQNDTSIVKAYGHFANNQIKDNVVTWIEGGMWNLNIEGIKNISATAPNMTAEFTANFTMIKPDGSLSHNHIINKFKSDNVIFAGNDIVITGTSDIHSDNGIEYSQVPITVHLMGKKVLGLMIDVNKTGGHFSGDNEMFGTMISGIGLDNSTTTLVSNGSSSSSIMNNGMTDESNDTSSTNTNMNSMDHMTH